MRFGGLAVRPDKFELRPAGAVEGRHVLVLDDVWTTGSNTQSAALTLRHAGAAAVSVMVVGRWLNPRYGATESSSPIGWRRYLTPMRVR